MSTNTDRYAAVDAVEDLIKQVQIEASTPGSPYLTAERAVPWYQLEPDAISTLAIREALYQAGRSELTHRFAWEGEDVVWYDKNNDVIIDEVVGADMHRHLERVGLIAGNWSALLGILDATPRLRAFVLDHFGGAA